MTLEERVQRIEDIEEIRLLRNSYSYSSNVDGMNGFREFADNFVEDGVFDGGFGPLIGPNQIFEALQPIPVLFACMMHITTNPTIVIDGDTATGKWTGLFPHILTGQTDLNWGNCYYHDEYVRTAQGWKFRSVKAEPFFFSRPWCGIFTNFLEINPNCIVAS